MKSIFDGHGTGGTSFHTIQYFDGQRIRELEVITYNGRVIWTEKTIPGILELRMSYRTVTRKITALERRATR